MTPASTSKAHSISHPESTQWNTRSAISTSAGAGSDSGHSTGYSSVLIQKLCGFFSPRKPPLSPSAENKQRGDLDAAPERPTLTPASASDVDIITGASTPDFEKVFRYLDQNGDGKLSPSELCSYMRAVGEDLSAEDAAAIVESTDSDGDGLLGFDDFVKLVDVGGEEERTRDLMEAFGMYEMKGQGRITPKSLRRALRRLGEAKTTEECKVMIRRFDLDGDGVLSFDEFKVMML